MMFKVNYIKLDALYGAHRVRDVTFSLTFPQKNGSRWKLIDSSHELGCWHRKIFEAHNP